MPLPRIPVLVLVIAVAAMPRLVAAQATISGRVTTETGTGLSDVTVSVPALGAGARTDDSGHYSFAVPAARVSGQVAALVARRVGYAPAAAQITLTPGATTHDFTMTQSALQLGEVIVTGAGTSQTRERIGSTINTVDSSRILRAATPQNIVTALTATALRRYDVPFVTSDQTVEYTVMSHPPPGSHVVRVVPLPRATWQATHELYLVKK